MLLHWQQCDDFDAVMDCARALPVVLVNVLTWKCDVLFVVVAAAATAPAAAFGPVALVLCLLLALAVAVG